MRHLRAWVVLWFVLWWLWMLLVGEWNHYEWIAATAAATVAATIGEIARSAAGVQARVPVTWLRRGWSAFLVVFTDFAIVMAALFTSALRRRVVRGVFRTHKAPVEGDDAEATGIRVWAALLADYSPNAYVVGFEDGRTIVHDLIPRRRSEEPA